MIIIRNIHYFLVVGWIALTSKSHYEMHERTIAFLMSHKDIQAKRPLHTHFLYERITGVNDNCVRIYKECDNPVCFGISQEALASFVNVTQVADGLPEVQPGSVGGLLASLKEDPTL